MADESGSVVVAARRVRRLRLAIGLNLVVVVVQVGAGLAAHSLGLLADAGHNLTDVAAVALSLVAVRLTTRAPTSERSFGYHRSTVLAAQANAGLILAVTGVIAYESIRRLLDPQPVGGGVVLVVALVAMVMNIAATAAVFDRSGDLNMRSAVVHLAGDALASLGVAVAGLVMLLTGGAERLDPLVSLAIAVVIAFEAVALLREATDVLLESTPGGLDLGDVLAAMRAVDGVDDVHDLHAWSLSSDVRALSAHVVVSGHPSLEEAQAVADDVKRAVARPFAISHATLELECEACVEYGGEPCTMDDLVRADVARQDRPGQHQH